MPRNNELLDLRNQHVLNRFRYHRKRNPKWTIQAVLDEVSRDTFLSPITIVKIIKLHDNAAKVPAPNTMIKYNRSRALAVA